MTLVKIECYKFFSNKKNLFTVGLLVVLMSALCITMLNKHETYHKSESERYSSAVSLAESHVTVLLLDQKRNLREINLDELAFWELESQLAQKLKVNYNFYDSSNWKMLLKTIIERNQNLIVGYDNNYITNARKSKKEMIASMTRENLVYQYFLDQNHQPYTRKQIYYSKILASILCSMGITAMIIILFTLGISMMNGFGQTQYPIAISTDNINLIFSDKLVDGLIIPLG